MDDVVGTPRVMGLGSSEGHRRPWEAASDDSPAVVVRTNWGTSYQQAKAGAGVGEPTYDIGASISSDGTAGAAGAEYHLGTAVDEPDAREGVVYDRATLDDDSRI